MPSGQFHIFNPSRSFPTNRLGQPQNLILVAGFTIQQAPDFQLIGLRMRHKVLLEEFDQAAACSGMADWVSRW
jgi:hypothetical protein